ncbi:MAG: hypothetical protein K2H41_14005 [Acetatifactor sp.]|nr:hypothetical protein [Acetatifactor sp.]
MLTEVIAEGMYKNFLLAMKVLGISFDFSFEVPSLDAFLGVLSSALYFFPWRYIWPIPVAICSLMMFRIGVTFVRFALSIIGKIIP